MKFSTACWLSLPLVVSAASMVACSSDDSTPTPPDGAAPDASETGIVTVTEAGSDGGSPDGTLDGGDGAPTGDATPASDSAPDSAPLDATVDSGSDSGVSQLAPLPGYTVSVFAIGKTGGMSFTGPDALELDGTTVWVGYQMGVVAKDGTDAGPPYSSEVVQYKLADGTLTGKSFSIPGHCDGVRVDPATHIVWATSNEDGNPLIESFDPSAVDGGGAVTKYTLGPVDHGGGLDDLAFFDGQMIVVDSNPSSPGTASALSVAHVSGTNITLSRFLAGNAPAYDVVNDVSVPLSLSDPDSLTIDNQGNLVLVGQGDKQLIIIPPQAADAGVDGGDAGIDGGDAGVDGGDAGVDASDAGLAPSIQVVQVATQLDDTVWATQASGMLLVADAKTNTIYEIHSSFKPGTVYTETPDDSSIPGIVGTVDLTTGNVNPVVLGFGKPTGMIFVKQ